MGIAFRLHFKDGRKSGLDGWDNEPYKPIEGIVEIRPRGQPPFKPGDLIDFTLGERHVTATVDIVTADYLCVSESPG